MKAPGTSRSFLLSLFACAVLATSSCTPYDTAPSSSPVVMTPSNKPALMFADGEDLCFSGFGWCHVYPDASMDNPFMSYFGSGGQICDAGCLTYELGIDYLPNVMYALDHGFDSSNPGCQQLLAYLRTALNDKRIRYYDIHVYDDQGKLVMGDSHWDTSSDPTGAVHLDADAINGRWQDLAYYLAHEGSHIVFNITQAEDAQAVAWGNTCAPR